MVELIILHWPQIMAVLGLVWWLARLESRVTNNGEEVKKLEKKLDHQFEERDDRRKEDMATLNLVLSEMRADIKTLLLREFDKSGKQ